MIRTQSLSLPTLKDKKDEVEVRKTVFEILASFTGITDAVTTLETQTTELYALINALPNGYVTLATNQTISGDKTFTSLQTRFQRGNAVALLLGADSTGSTLTDSVDKNARLGVPHYTNSEQPLAVFLATSSSSLGVLNIGGGSGLMNSATEVALWAASNNTTLTGTKQVSITSSGTQFLTPVGVNMAPSARVLGVLNTSDGTAARFTRSTSATASSGAVAYFRHLTSGDMADNFGLNIYLQVEDNAGVANDLVMLQALRNGADNTGIFRIFCALTGTMTQVATFRANGTAGLDVIGELRGDTFRLDGAGTTAPGTTLAPVFTSFYGGNTIALGDPTAWITISDNGTARKIPCY